jgi:hypothetical protein
MIKLDTALYLDDVRTPTEKLIGFKPWEIVRNYEEFVQWIETNGLPSFVSFDHDLADEHMVDYYNNQARGIQTINYDNFKEKTGIDCLNYLLEIVQNQIEAGQEPVLTTINVHSHNPIGKANIFHKAENFKTHTGWNGHVIAFNIPFYISENLQK